MKILVTGAAGFIGSAIVPVLKASDHDIYVIDNLTFGRRDIVDVSDSNFYVADIRDARLMDKILDQIQPEIIVHLAAIHFIPYCNAHPYESADVNIRGTINLLNASKKVKSLKKFLFASTAAVYPICDEAVNETHELLPMDIYGLSKLTGERLCTEFYLETGIDTIICRFFNAFGPNETNPHLIPEIEKQLREGARLIKLGNLTPKRDFIHTHDMAAALKQLISLNNTGLGIYNLGRGIEYSVVEIVEAFSRQLNEEIKIEVDPERIRKIEREHLLADVTKLKNTGWQPLLGIDEGIRDLIHNWN
ncbi:MAG TPA: NAD(P)-dependent oxidoreductase [Bacteroidales bacterium]|nr:NAD(P)-dependent oxidoreductase [Bacteroidales bacterium]